MDVFHEPIAVWWMVSIHQDRFVNGVWQYILLPVLSTIEQGSGRTMCLEKVWSLDSCLHADVRDVWVQWFRREWLLKDCNSCSGKSVPSILWFQREWMTRGCFVRIDVWDERVLRFGWAGFGAGYVTDPILANWPGMRWCRECILVGFGIMWDVVDW